MNKWEISNNLKMSHKQFQRNSSMKQQNGMQHLTHYEYVQITISA